MSRSPWRSQPKAEDESSLLGYLWCEPASAKECRTWQKKGKSHWFGFVSERTLALVNFSITKYAFRQKSWFCLHAVGLKARCSADLVVLASFGIKISRERKSTNSATIPARFPHDSRTPGANSRTIPALRGKFPHDSRTCQRWNYSLLKACAKHAQIQRKSDDYGGSY